MYVFATVEATVECAVRAHALTFSTFLSHSFNQLDIVAILLSWPSVLSGDLSYQALTLPPYSSA